MRAEGWAGTRSTGMWPANHPTVMCNGHQRVRLSGPPRLLSALKLGTMETDGTGALSARSSVLAPRSPSVIPLNALCRYAGGFEQWGKGYVCRRPRATK